MVVENHHKAIVPRKLFDRVQRKLTGQRNGRNTGPDTSTFSAAATLRRLRRTYGRGSGNGRQQVQKILRLPFVELSH